MASQALHVTGRAPPLALEGFLELVRSHVAPVGEDRILGPELARLTEAITARVFVPDRHIDSTSA
jgi:histidine ammonia-lyase